MAGIQQLRQKYPQYDGLTDKEFADKFHAAYYSDIPKGAFYSQLGLVKGASDKGFSQKARAFGGGVSDTLSFGTADELTGLQDSLGSRLGEKAKGNKFLGMMARATGNAFPATRGFTGAFAYGQENGAVDYATARDDQRVRDAYDEEYNGGSRLAGQIAGAFVPIPGTGVVRGVKTADTALTSLRALKAGKTGAAYGAAYGFGSGEGGFGERAQNAATMGVLGAGFGAGGTVAIDKLAKPALKGLQGKYADYLMRSASETQRKADVNLAAKKSGVRLPRVVTGNSAQKLLYNAAKATLSGRGVIDNAEQATIDDLGSRFANIVDAAAPGNPTAYGRGKELQAGGQRWIDSEDQAAEKLYSNVRQYMPDVSRVNPQSTINAFRAVTSKYGPDELQKILGNEKLSKVAKALQSAADGGEFNYADAKQLRRDIGSIEKSMIRGSDSPLDISAIEGIYKGLTDDILNTARGISPKAEKAVMDADANYSRFKDTQKKVVDAITGNLKKDVTPELAASRLTASATGRGGRSDLAMVVNTRKTLDDKAWGSFVANTLEELARPTTRGEAGTGFSVGNFAKNYANLKPEMRNVLLSGKFKALRGPLDDLAIVAKELESMKSFGNPSGTGQTGATLATIGTAAIDLKTLFFSQAAGYGLAKWLSHPKTAQWYANTAKAIVRVNRAKSALESTKAIEALQGQYVKLTNIANDNSPAAEIAREMLSASTPKSAAAQEQDQEEPQLAEGQP